MAVTLYLRRRRTTSDGGIGTVPRSEFLFLTAETFDPVLSLTPIAPKLPGNDATSLAGGGTNFIFNIGTQQATLRVAGTLIPLPRTSFPTLNSPDIHVVGRVTRGAAEQTLTVDPKGADFRTSLYDYVADQADTTDWDPTQLYLGTPDWGGKSFGRSAVDIATPWGVSTREWNGVVTNLRTQAIAGRIDQFLFSFDFVVGAPA
jgi:hypothetical protein